MLWNVKKRPAKAEPGVKTVKSLVNTEARPKSHKRSGDDLTNYVGQLTIHTGQPMWPLSCDLSCRVYHNYVVLAFDCMCGLIALAIAPKCVQLEK